MINPTGLRLVPHAKLPDRAGALASLATLAKLDFDGLFVGQPNGKVSRYAIRILQKLESSSQTPVVSNIFCYSQVTYTLK